MLHNINDNYMQFYALLEPYSSVVLLSKNAKEWLIKEDMAYIFGSSNSSTINVMDHLENKSTMFHKLLLPERIWLRQLIVTIEVLGLIAK